MQQHWRPPHGQIVTNSVTLYCNRSSSAAIKMTLPCFSNEKIEEARYTRQATEIGKTPENTTNHRKCCPDRLLARGRGGYTSGITKICLV